MKTPKFWYTKSLISLLFAPFSIVYYLLFLITRKWGKKKREIFCKSKLICVGNLTAGGSGKTPVCQAIGEFLKENKRTFCYLSRGYGRRTKGFGKVNSKDIQKYGDEPIILSEISDTYVYSHINNAKMLDGAYEFIIMDDGLQNFTFNKDLSILVLDKNFGFGNQKLIPAGPLRCKITDIDFDVKIESERVPEFPLNPCEIVAFSGLGNNENFIKMLIDSGFKIVKFHEFADHHVYMESDLKFIKSATYPILTTQKDFIKLPIWAKNMVICIKIKIILDNRTKNLLLNITKN
jgi:tetraacyldisaccharide 4'-kinase